MAGSSNQIVSTSGIKALYPINGAEDQKGNDMSSNGRGDDTQPGGVHSGQRNRDELEIVSRNRSYCKAIDDMFKVAWPMKVDWRAGDGGVVVGDGTDRAKVHNKALQSPGGGESCNKLSSE